jgi:hypothetical protein
MDTNLLDIKFTRIGARLKVADRPSRRSRTAGVISLDVQADRKGEFFEIIRQPGAETEIAVLDVQPADRHLLLLVREGKDKSKFLCGHDERHRGAIQGHPGRQPEGEGLGLAHHAAQSWRLRKGAGFVMPTTPRSRSTAGIRSS